MFTHGPRCSPPAIVAGMLLLACACGKAHGAEPLRWKLAAGETLQVAFVQTANTETVGAGTPTTISILMEMEMTWKVREVAEDGTATLVQSFDRLAMSMRTGDVVAVDYDSALPSSSPAAREIGAAVKPLIGRTFSLVMSDRGAIRDVKLAAADQPADAPATAAGIESFFSIEGISRVLRQSVVELPEQPVETGATWESTSEIESALGVLQQTNVYSYAGPEERDGRAVEKIGVESTLQADQEGRRSKTTIKAQSQTGELWFDRQAGRLVGSQFEQQLTTQRPYRDTRIEVRSTSKLTTTFR